MEIYIVIKGEMGEGGVVENMFSTLRDARLFALEYMLDRNYPGETWLMRSDVKSWEKNGDVVASWERGCDYLDIQKWEVK